MTAEIYNAIRNLFIKITSNQLIGFKEKKYCFEITYASNIISSENYCRIVIINPNVLDYLKFIEDYKVKITCQYLVFVTDQNRVKYPTKFKIFNKETKGLIIVSSKEFYGLLVTEPSLTKYKRIIESKMDFDFRKFEYNSYYQDRYFRIINSFDGNKEKIFNSDKFILEWGNINNSRRPIFLIGERGTGKSWQLYHICEILNREHKKKPWLYGPAVYFNLRGIVNKFSASSNSIPYYPDNLENDYNLIFNIDNRLLKTALSNGYIILCLDGFEEVNKGLHSEINESIDNLQRICSILGIETKFIIAGRLSHFGSLHSLLNTRAYPDKKIGDTFEIIQIEPFEEKTIKLYSERVELSEEYFRHYSSLLGIENCLNIIDNELLKAIMNGIKQCIKVPALLSAITNYYRILEFNKECKPVYKDLIENLLINTIVNHNIDLSKSQKIFIKKEKGGILSPVLLDIEFKKQLLGELAWHYSLLGIEMFCLEKTPSHLKAEYFLYNQMIVNEIRTHTLFDIENEERIEHADIEESLGKGNLVSFAIKISNDYYKNGQNRIIKLGDYARKIAPAGTLSLSGSYFLANHIYEMLCYSIQIPNNDDLDNSVINSNSIRYLGEIPLGLEAGYLLKEKLLSRPIILKYKEIEYSSEKLNEYCSDILVDYAKRGDYSLFSSCLRFVGHNLEVMGYIDQNERFQIDPWVDDKLSKIFEGSASLSKFKMALVSSTDTDCIPDRLKKSYPDQIVSNKINKPFLIGVREITNEDFLCFLDSSEGQQWRVENITVAGGGDDNLLSKYAKYANEYYLYFWQKSQNQKSNSSVVIQPLVEHLNDPVVYISWYSAAAFCNWLSTQNNLDAPYKLDYNRDDNNLNKDDNKIGFRLPTIQEWNWAARGGVSKIDYSWELFPFCLSDKNLSKWGSANKEDDRVYKWFVQKRMIYKKCLIDSTKKIHPVLSDSLNPFGLSAMIGNVKEWCHDVINDNDTDVNVILGATSFLGENSYGYDYGVTLLPQNTNPDVGFRIARDLTESELYLLNSIQTRISSINIKT